MTIGRARTSLANALRAIACRARDRIVTPLVLLAAMGGVGSVCVAQGDPAVTEQAVKAAFIYKFLDYVEWPAGSLGADGEPLTIGVLGARSLADELAEITAGRRIHDRSIRVRRVEPRDALDDLSLLFVGGDEADRLAALIAPARRRPILTVTESADAVSAGSIINFVVEDRRVRFEISLGEAEQSGLRLNSRLLAVAKQVHREPTIP